MRYKSWPYFKDWGLIFGKDRAAGDITQAWQDIVQEEAQIPVPNEDVNPLEEGETESVNVGTKPGEASSSMKPCKRKRSRVTDVHNPQMFDMMSSFFSDVSGQIGSLVTKVGVEKDAKGQRQNLIKELANMPLSLEDKLTVTKKICANVNDVDIFYGLTEEQRITMVQMVLKGKY